MKIRPVGAEFQADGRRDITKLIVAFRKFSNAPWKVRQPLYGTRQSLRVEVEASRFHDSRHMKVVKLSALRTGRFYPTRKYTFLLEA